MARIIGVFSGKGGVGKTTTVVNLGTALATKFNRDVAMIDCNVTSPHLGLHLDIFNAPLNLNHMLKGEKSAEEVLYSYMPNLKFIPASVNLADLEGLRMDNLKPILERDFNDFDFVLLDSAAGFGKEAVSTLMVADEILFVTNPDAPSVSDIIKGREIAEGMNKDITGLVINRSQGKRFELSRQEIENLTELPVLEMIPEDRNVLRSIAAKKPLVIEKPYSKASIGYLRLGAKMLGRNYQPTTIEKIRSILN
jgi:cell division ATPase MinD